MVQTQYNTWEFLPQRYYDTCRMLGIDCHILNANRIHWDRITTKKYVDDETQRQPSAFRLFISYPDSVYHKQMSDIDVWQQAHLQGKIFMLVRNHLVEEFGPNDRARVDRPKCADQNGHILVHRCEWTHPYEINWAEHYHWTLQPLNHHYYTS